MTTMLEDMPPVVVVDPAPVAPRRRARGLRMPVLPSGPLLAQLGGAATALGGAYLAWGGAVTMIIGGVATAVLGMLREAGRI